MKSLISFILVIVLAGALCLSACFPFDNNEAPNTEQEIESTEEAEENTSSTFTVVYNGEEIKSSKSYIFGAGEHSFEIKFADGTNKNYSIKIMPNLRVGFTLNGQATILEEDEELTNAFNLEKSDNSFKLTLTSEENLKTILEKIYPTKSVNVSSQYKKSTMAFYRFLITTDNPDDGYCMINFGLGIPVSELLLPGTLEF